MCEIILRIGCWPSHREGKLGDETLDAVEQY
jgi:hypothetical protein